MNLEEIKKKIKLYRLKYLIRNNKFDSITKMKLRDMFPELTEEILTEYGPAIIKYLENETGPYWGNTWNTEYLLKYLMKPEINRLDLIAKMRLEVVFPELTEEILTEYGPAIIKYLENEFYSPWNNECLLKYLKENGNRFDLIAKMRLEYIFPELTEEILKEYGPAIIKYLENETGPYWGNTWNDKCLLEYLKDNNRFDLIAKMNLYKMFPELTEEVLKEYGPAIIKYLENINLPWNDKYLFKYLKDNNRLDLSAKMNLAVIFPKLTEEITTEYGPEIIDFIKHNSFSYFWKDNRYLFRYLKEKEEFDLIAKMDLGRIYPELTEEILTECGPVIIKYLEEKENSPWNDKCLLEYLKEKERFDLIEKMNLYAIFPNLTEEILNEYGPAIIKYLEDENYCLWGDKCLLEYLIRHDRMDLIKKLNFDISSIEAILPILENIYNISREVLKYKINYLYNRNDEIFSTLNFEILKLNIPLEILLTITLYPEMQEKIINLDNVVSSKLFEIIKKVQSKKYDTVQITESILKNASNYEELLNNLDINSLNENELNNLIYVLQNENNIFNISSIEDLKEENFKKKKDIYFRNIDNNLDNLVLDDLKEAIVESIYGISLERAKFISDRYSYDFDALRKDKLNEKIISIVENLNKIVNETDISKLKVIYQTRNDISGLKTDFMSSLSLEASIREEYARMYSNTLYKVNESDLSKNQKLDNVTYQGKKIEVYEPESKFNMQIHALGAYSSFSRPDNFKDDWLKPKIAYHGICTSFIANNEIATARQRHPILGFSNYEEKALLLAGNYDLGSDQANLSFATSNYKSGKFLPPKTMIDATRHNHNEMVIERMKHDSGRISKRTPNYIIYIIDDMNNKNNFDENNELYQENLQAAYDFDIPIVIIDRLKYAKQEKEKCDLLEQEFNNSRNPEILRELFLNYMNNWVGCRYFEINPKAEYNDIFNDEVVCEFYKRITGLIKNDIHKIKDITKTNEEILMMIRLLQHERDCRVLDTFNGKQEPFSIQESLIEYQEILKEFKSKLTSLKQNEVTQDVVLEETVSKTM